MEKTFDLQVRCLTIIQTSNNDACNVLIEHSAHKLQAVTTASYYINKCESILSRKPIILVVLHLRVLKNAKRQIVIYGLHYILLLSVNLLCLLT